VAGFTRIEKLSWDNYNEGTDLIEQIKAYKERYGYYPESVHVDKIYQNRENRAFCQEHNIRITGPILGRPRKEETSRERFAESEAMKKLLRQDACERQPVEGKFGNLKRKYGLDRIMTKLSETSESEIATAILMLNLEVVLRGRPLIVFIFLRIFVRKFLRNYRKAQEYFNKISSRECSQNYIRLRKLLGFYRSAA
jgi:hypothetical protein